MLRQNNNADFLLLEPSAHGELADSDISGLTQGPE